ncbi:MAG: hypothetical protein GMKNLPBB_03133 [Myxococcota bacterium]|nr:hypothetical protein [Myxococcota bacterium]
MLVKFQTAAVLAVAVLAGCGDSAGTGDAGAAASGACKSVLNPKTGIWTAKSVKPSIDGEFKVFKFRVSSSSVTLLSGSALCEGASSSDNARISFSSEQEGATANFTADGFSIKYTQIEVQGCFNEAAKATGEATWIAKGLCTQKAAFEAAPDP